MCFMIFFSLEQYIWWSYATWDNTPTKRLDVWQNPSADLGKPLFEFLVKGVDSQNNIDYCLCPSLSPRTWMYDLIAEDTPHTGYRTELTWKPLIWGLALTVSVCSIQATKGGGGKQHSYAALQSKKNKSSLKV